MVYLQIDQDMRIFPSLRDLSLLRKLLEVGPGTWMVGMGWLFRGLCTSIPCHKGGDPFQLVTAGETVVCGVGGHYMDVCPFKKVLMGRSW